ncbi:spermatogenesis-associated protein 33 isoform X1 [Mustela erminea]|uniref:spermatogenesis-associated protein 33 isoform X1 n=1 Tax=Mustela erminea TaxID=36723 RepID=UPI0013869D78|nr:spermatogenesis-associated protein 33 isoform X1 [Mustela erminea]
MSTVTSGMSNKQMGPLRPSSTQRAGTGCRHGWRLQGGPLHTGGRRQSRAPALLPHQPKGKCRGSLTSDSLQARRPGRAALPARGRGRGRRTGAPRSPRSLRPGPRRAPRGRKGPPRERGLHRKSKNPDGKVKASKKKVAIPQIIITRASRETLTSYSSIGSDEQRTIKEQVEWTPYYRHRNPSTVDAYRFRE